MSKFEQGQIVVLKSDNNITGAIVATIESYPETRYQVFTTVGLQTYYESQLISQEIQEKFEKVSADRFHAGLTASVRLPLMNC